MTSDQLTTILEMLKRKKSYGDIGRAVGLTKKEVKLVALGRRRGAIATPEERKASEGRIGG
jgi:hypothetical protein